MDHANPTATFGPAAAPNPSHFAADPLRPATQEWERTYAMWTHLMLLAGHFVPLAPSLIMWLVKRDQSAYVDDHGKEAVNFQISLILYFIASAILMFVGIGFVLLFAAYALAIIGMAMGASGAHKGRYYRYPACIRFIK